jgi:hypothetical protein
MKFYVLILFSLFSIGLVAQVNTSDSITKAVFLNEVVISASNITRVDNHLLIYPNEQQRKYANSGYGVLKNLMIPGLIVDAQIGSVEAMGIQASLYINGQECDSRDIKMIRPRDIDKIEYYDAPSGKYAKDKIAINFVLKQYKYGGYVQADATQTIGYTHGDYNLAGSFSYENTTYSLFVGTNYENIRDNELKGIESYYIPGRIINHTMESYIRYGKHNEYAQFRIQNRKGKRYLTGKFSLINNSVPKTTEKGTGFISQFSTQSKQHSIAPKLDLNGEIPLSDNENLSLGLHGKYSHNTYDRQYTEQSFESVTYESENVGDFQISAIYDRFGKKSSFSAELYHYHNIWNAKYTGSYPLWQHLWQYESLAFIAYNYSFPKKISLRSRVGMDWLQYKLHGDKRFSQISPRFNVNIQYNLSPGMLLWSFNFVNSNYGMDVINNAIIDINPYMIKMGNPELKKSYDLNTYLYYSSQLNKVGLTAICQYQLYHNPVMDNYYTNNLQIIKTFINEGNTHYISAIIAATYSFGKSVNMSGDIRYNYTAIDSKLHDYNDNLTGNLSMNIYTGKFAINPHINFNKRVLDRTTLIHKTLPVNYGIACSYNHKNLFAEVQIESPFTKRRGHYILNTPYYVYDVYRKDITESRYCNIKISYSFDFGRKTNKIKRDIDNNINSSLLRVIS